MEEEEVGEDSQPSHHSLPVCLQLRTTRLLLQQVHLVHQPLLPVHSGTLPLRRPHLATTPSRPRLAHHSAASDLHLGPVSTAAPVSAFASSNPSPFGPTRTQAEAHCLSRLPMRLGLLSLSNQLSVLPPTTTTTTTIFPPAMSLPSLRIHVLRPQIQREIFIVVQT